MDRTGLYIALALAVIVGGIFGVFPGLDLRIAELFAKPDYRPDFSFGLRLHPGLWWLREAAMWITTLLAAPAVGALVMKAILPRSRMLIPGRAAVFLTVSLALAPGLVANVLLKDHWGRPRPVDVVQFGGAEHFVPWWDPRGDCDKNCSFVSGDVSGAFWTLAPAALAPAPWRPVAYGAALVLGTATALFRMMAGGHFFSDVFFAGFFTFMVVWLSYAVIYRWSRVSDEDVDQGMERAIVSTADGASSRAAALGANAAAGAKRLAEKAMLQVRRIGKNAEVSAPAGTMPALTDVVDVMRRALRRAAVKFFLLVDPNALADTATKQDRPASRDTPR